MKKAIIFLLLIMPLISNSQERFRVGVSMGAYSYSTDGYGYQTHSYIDKSFFSGSNWQIELNNVTAIAKRTQIMFTGTLGTFTNNYARICDDFCTEHDEYDRAETNTNTSYWGVGILLKKRLFIKDKHSVYLLFGGEYKDGINTKRSYDVYKNNNLISESNFNGESSYNDYFNKWGLTYQRKINDKYSYYIEPNVSFGLRDIGYYMDMFTNVSFGITIL